MDPLLQQARDGDPAAWQSLVDGHRPKLQRYLIRRMGVRLRRCCSVSDLAQEVFTRMLQAIQAAPEDAAEATFQRWLFRHADWVLANRGLQARRHFGESAVPTSASVSSPATGPVTRQDEAAWLQRLLAHLDPAHGEVVRLRLAGATFAVIGERLGITEANARQRFSRVVRELAATRAGRP
ncbi:MAG: RNA polymerase sigma factor [Planctomycetes bacterium]|nr:RNA polymerase sigma factor [Planctomycetota bacterium]